MGELVIVISDVDEWLKADIQRVLGATWQRCRVHFMRNVLAHVPKGQHTVVAAARRSLFAPARNASSLAPIPRPGRAKRLPVSTMMTSVECPKSEHAPS